MKLFSTKMFYSLAAMLTLSTSVIAADFQLPSFEPPAGLAVDSVPLFIVLGFDDNRYVDGMNWVLDLLEDKKNPAGTGNADTFDGTPALAAFYHTSGALEEGGDALLDTWKEALARGHEVANHTVTHNTSKALSKAEWIAEIDGCRTTLIEKLGVTKEDVVGFRTPYLDFNSATFEAVNELGMLYECTMTQMQDYNQSQFLWPYTLDEGFADKTIDGWKGKSVIPGLWEIPVYTVGENDLMWPPITGFDSSVLTQANGSKYELMLKNSIDYRMKPGGNRAPLTVGLHSDTYAESNPSGTNYDDALDLAGRKAALTNFIEYALTFPEVRFVTAIQLIEWMRNPIPLGRTAGTSIQNVKTVNGIAPSIRSEGNSLSLTVPQSGNYSVSIVNALGRVVGKESISALKGATNMLSSTDALSTGVYFYTIAGVGFNESSSFIKQ